MILRHRTKHLLAAVLLLAGPINRAWALLNFDGTRNQIFVFGHLSFAYSSNIFSDSTNRGDSTVTGEAGLEFRRNAGVIAVTSTLKFDYQRFARYTGESAFDPSLAIELTKATGRTTGSLTASVYRESRSDSALNLRTNSWNVPVDLSVKYPLNEIFYLTSQTGYVERNYIGNPTLENYRDYSEALDAFYVYSSKLDLDAGYRLRASKTTTGADTYDHWFYVGATGNLLAKLNGSARVGYQVREIDGGPSFSHYNALAALTWPVTRKLLLTGLVSRDFNTIATGSSVDSTSLALRANYAFTRKIDADAGAAVGRNDFLNGASANRRDHFFSWDLAAHYKMNEHLRLAVGYNYLHNWSSLSFADFERHGFSFEVSSRF